MKQTNKRNLAIAIASALAIGAATELFARGAFGPGPGWGEQTGMRGGLGRIHRPFGGPGMMGRGDPVAAAEQRLTQLKTALGITPDQELAWNGYADAVKGKAGLMASHRQAMLGTEGMVASEQRRGFRQQARAQRQQLQAASRNLYAALTPAQQARTGRFLGPRCLDR
mgnify:CR=1 FL=1